MDEKLKKNNDDILHGVNVIVENKRCQSVTPLEKGVKAMEEKQLLQAIGQLIDEKMAVFATKDDLEAVERRVSVIIENGYQRIENLLREDYGRVADAAAKGAAVAESHQQIKSTVADHESALKDHNERIQALEKKAI